MKSETGAKRRAMTEQEEEGLRAERDGRVLKARFVAVQRVTVQPRSVAPGRLTESGEFQIVTVVGRIIGQPRRKAFNTL